MVAQLDRLYVKIRPTKAVSRMIGYLLFEGRPLTTRGRWINPLVAGHFALEKRLPQLKSVRQPIFVIGTGRSGTTILGKILSMHCDVAFLNEPKALWHSVIAEDDLIGSYSVGAAKYRLAPESATDRVRELAHKLYGAYLACTLSNRIVDKYPEMVFRVPFLKTIFPDAKFVFLVRNGWDTCHSIAGWSQKYGRHSDGIENDWWGAGGRKWRYLVEQIVAEHQDLLPFKEDMLDWTDHSSKAALEWIVSMREGLAMAENYPDDIFTVRYEDLCARPKESLAKLLAFVNLDANDDKMIRFAESVLRVNDSKEPVGLHCCLEKPFYETMQRLGYGL